MRLQMEVFRRFFCLIYYFYLDKPNPYIRGPNMYITSEFNFKQKKEFWIKIMKKNPSTFVLSNTKSSLSEDSGTQVETLHEFD